MKRILGASAIAAFAASIPVLAAEPAPVPSFHDFEVQKEFTDNPFAVLRGRGMLVCAGDREKGNAMTIGWGAFGTLWGRDAVTVYVAESRHTKKFLDGATHFTVMEFDKARQADILDYMGRHSGRDGDKAAALGLHTAWTENGTPYYEEAQAVYECETMYSAPFEQAGMRDIPKTLYADFPAGVHSMYIGRVIRAFRRDAPAEAAAAAQDPVNRNKDAMRLFEKCINTNDLELGRRLISDKAAFATPVSPEPLHGAEGYLSVVSLMRASFPDVQWKLEDMVADEKTVAVRWTCTGTFAGKAPFAGLQPNGRKFSTSVMNFYVFDDDGRIIDDIAATGMLGILQGIGAGEKAGQ